MKKRYLFLLALVVLTLVGIVPNRAEASMQSDAIITRVQQETNGECDGYADNGGQRYCECDLVLEGKTTPVKLCKKRTPQRVGMVPGDSTNISAYVDLPAGNCQMGLIPSGIGRPVDMKCKIKSVKKPDGCDCRYIPNGYKNEKPANAIVAFGGGNLEIRQPSTLLTEHQTERLTAIFPFFDKYEYVCPANTIFQSGTFFDASKWDCSRAVYRDTTRCCCAALESGSATTKYSCELKTGFGTACGTDEKMYDVPSDGKCDSLTTTGKVTVDKENLGVGNDKLLREVATLNQLKGFTTPQELIGKVINVLLSFLGSIALGLYIWSGVLWTTAAGNSERVETSKKIIIWTTAGVVAILSSYVLVKFIFSTLGSST